MNNSISKRDIAIIGMSGVFPGASDLTEFWEKLKSGITMTRTYIDQELEDLGLAKELIDDPAFVKVDAKIKHPEHFDAKFFNYSEDEAAMMDPQMRLFHEQVWAALEDAAYDPATYKGRIGVYASASDNLNWRVYNQIHSKENVNPFLSNLISNKNFISLFPSYRFNLKGPSLFLNTACSTSLVLVHEACRALMLGECNISVVGAVRIASSTAIGYKYEEGLIFSEDGRCQTFDMDASGTIDGEGAGVIVLKRLVNAVADRDHIHAVIKSTAINNDGDDKVGFTAPSISGQESCIKMAHKLAGITPEKITYVEAHGTGTKIGDPIEVAALNKAFGYTTEKHCAIGSVKSNIGHLDVAAGMAGLIKTVLSLKHQVIPPTHNFTKPNPTIDFDGGPFYVNNKVQEWKSEENMPRRAGVSSFGLGGTNAHVVLEEYPQNVEKELKDDLHLINLSAKSKNSLLKYIETLKNFTAQSSDLSLADMAYTLQVGRGDFKYRYATLVKDKATLIEKLSREDIAHQIVENETDVRSVVFMFSGAGTQYADMGKELYEQEPVFKKIMSEGFIFLNELTGINYESIVYPKEGGNRKVIHKMLHTQPIIFLFEYALARLMMSFGIQPKYMIGHSLGEYVAACISGIFTFEDALKLVVRRGELMNEMPNGAMVSVHLSEAQAIEYTNDKISLAAINGSEQVVLSGTVSSVDELIKKFEQKEIPFVKLYASIAGHSYMIDDILDQYKTTLEETSFGALKLPFISGRTGKLVDEVSCRTVGYWLEHMRKTVRFSDGIDTLIQKDDQLVFLEVGSSNSLAILLNEKRIGQSAVTAVNLVRHPKEIVSDVEYLSNRIGQVWAQGAWIDWSRYHKDSNRRRISLPTYSFDTYKFPARVDIQRDLNSFSSTTSGLRRYTIDQWFNQITWKHDFWIPVNDKVLTNDKVIIFSDQSVFVDALTKQLSDAGRDYVIVEKGVEFQMKRETLFTIDPNKEETVEELLSTLEDHDFEAGTLLYLWTCDSEEEKSEINETEHYDVLLNLVKEYSAVFPMTELDIMIIGKSFYNVLGNEKLLPRNAILGSLTKVLSKEFFNVSCKIIDIADLSSKGLDLLWKEINYNSDHTEIAIRNNRRYRKDISKIKFDHSKSGQTLKDGGTYLLTGADSKMAATISRFINQEFNCTLVLLAAELPDYLDELKVSNNKVFHFNNDFKVAKELDAQLNKNGIQKEKINGVFHITPTTGSSNVLLARNKKYEAQLFTEKIERTKVLCELFNGCSLDFFITNSSVDIAVGPIGSTARLTADLFQYALSEKETTSYPLINIAWDVLGEQQEEIGLSYEEIIPVIQNSIYLKLPNILISTVPFEASLPVRIEYQPEEKRKEEANSKTDVEFVSSTISEVNRANLSTPYTLPETTTEKKLVELMEQFFKINGIGTNDSFFELGGDSLRGMIVLKKIKQEFNVHLSLKEFFSNPTIAEISNKIRDADTSSNEKETARKIMKI